MDINIRRSATPGLVNQGISKGDAMQCKLAQVWDKRS
jgi:hypothetical protein